MGQPGGACFSPPSHRTSRLRAEPTRTPHVHPCYHPCRTCCASPRPPRARLPATDGVGKAGVALGVECVCVYVFVCVRACVCTYCVFIGVLAVFSSVVLSGPGGNSRPADWRSSGLCDGDSQAFSGLTFHTPRSEPRESCQLCGVRPNCPNFSRFPTRPSEGGVGVGLCCIPPGPLINTPRGG